MTEKRFVKYYAGRTKKRAIGIKDIETNRVYVTIEGNIHLLNELTDENKELKEENEQLKQQIKDLRIGVLDSIHEADEIQCTCNPCVVEECVKRVVE